MVLPPLDPAWMLTAVGVALRVKPVGTAVMVSPMVALADNAPEVPVTVTV